MELARKSIFSGAAYEKLVALIRASGGSLTKLEEYEAMYE
jgi:thymidine phosphorylase